MIYTQLQVLETLRKYPKSSLWNYEHRKWNDEQRQQFEELRTGIKKPKKEAMIRENYAKPHLMKKIIRVSDGKVYESIKDCALKNSLSATAINNSIYGRQKTQRFKFYEEK